MTSNSSIPPGSADAAATDPIMLTFDALDIAATSETALLEMRVLLQALVALTHHSDRVACDLARLAHDMANSQCSCIGSDHASLIRKVGRVMEHNGSLH